MTCPRGVVLAEEGPRVALGDVGEVLATLERVHVALLPHGAQQAHRQRPGADAGLDHPGAGEDVGHRDDLPRVLGVDHGRATGHGHDVVGQQRAQGEVLDPGGVADDGAVGGADEVVVGEPPAVGVELAAGLERDGVQATLGVGQLDPLPRAERAASQVGAMAAVGLVEVLAHARAQSRCSQGRRRARRRRGDPAESAPRPRASWHRMAASTGPSARLGRPPRRCSAPGSAHGRRQRGVRVHRLGAAFRPMARTRHGMPRSSVVTTASGPRPEPTPSGVSGGRTAPRSMTSATREPVEVRQGRPAPDGLGRTGPQDRADDQHPDAAEARGRHRRAAGDPRNHRTTSTATTRPHQPATTAPLLRSAARLPDQALHDLTAVERHAGQDVEHRERAVDDRPVPRRGARGCLGRPAAAAPDRCRRGRRSPRDRQRRRRPSAQASSARPRTRCGRPRGSRRSG